MKNNEYFGLASAEDLYFEIKQALGKYLERPNFHLLLFLVFSLNHLREWITGYGFDVVNKKIKEGNETEEDKLFLALWDMPDFKIINSLCNQGKHSSIKREKIGTYHTEGFNVDSPCTDPLDQKYYFINGRDSRDVLYSVFSKYKQWFE